MINEFVSGSVSIDMDAALNEYNSFMESCDNEIDTMFAEFNMMHEKVMLESEIMDSVPEDMMMVYEAGKSNIFTKIGEFVIKIFTKIKEFIDKGIAKLKEITFKSKSDMQKIDIFLKKNPHLKNEEIDIFKDAVSKGAINFDNIKNVKDVSIAFNELIELSKKKDIDPKSFRGRVEKFKEKLKNLDKSTVVVGVSAIGTVGGAILYIKKFMPDMVRATNTLNEQKKILDENKANALERLRTLKKTVKIDKNATGTKEVINDEIGIAELTLQITRLLSNKISAVTNDNVNFFTKMANGIAKLADMLNPDSKAAAKRLMHNLDDVKKNKEKDEEKELEDRKKQVKEETLARKEAEREDHKNHAEEYKQQTKADFAARKEAELEDLKTNAEVYRQKIKDDTRAKLEADHEDFEEQPRRRLDKVRAETEERAYVNALHSKRDDKDTKN